MGRFSEIIFIEECAKDLKKEKLESFYSKELT